MIICPILSQQRRAEDGSHTWEHHECIEDSCTFWAADAKDCALRASGLAILRRESAPPPPPPQPPPDPAVVLKEPLAKLDSLEQKLEEVADRSATSSRELGLSLLAGVAALEQPVNALREEVDSIRGKVQEFAGVFSQVIDLLERQRRSEEERGARDRAEEARECNARGLALYHQGAYEAAETAFRRAVELEPGLAEAYNNLGLTLGRTNRPEEATAAFEKALEIRPDLPSALNNLGFLHHEGMRFEKAIDLFRRAAMDGSDSSIAWTNLGNACYKLDRKAEAVDAWRKAIEKDPLNEAAARSLRLFEGAGAGS